MSKKNGRPRFMYSFKCSGKACESTALIPAHSPKDARKILEKTYGWLIASDKLMYCINCKSLFNGE